MIDLIPDVVLAIVSINNLCRNLLRVLLTCKDADFEIVTTRGTILALIVTSLDDELDWLVDGAVCEQTRAVAERFLGFGVQEECESGVGRREVIASKSELHDGRVTSIALVWGGSCESCLVHEGTHGERGALWSGTDCGFSARREVDRAGLLGEADASDRDLYTTGDLAKRRVNACNGIAGTDDL